MMDPKLLAIPMAFILLAALLCWHVISATGSWKIKLALIIVVPSFGIVVWKSIASYQGWPTDDPLPEKALLLWAEVREPERGDGQGAIYLWLIRLEEREGAGLRFLDYADDRGEPRAYRMPYSRGTHKMLDQAQKMLRAGRPVVLEKGGRAGEEGGGADGLGADGREQEYKIYELPPTLPPKAP